MPPTIPIRTYGKQLEADFKKAGAQWLRIRFAREVFCLPIAAGPYQKAGSPDQVWSLRGQACFIEWKRNDGKARHGPKQKEMIDEIKACGGRAGFVECWQDLWDLVADIPPVHDVPLPGVQLGMMK